MSTETSGALAARLSASGCVFAEEEAALLIREAGTIEEAGTVREAGQADHLENMVRRRIAGEPLEQILGWAEFCGLRIPVAPGVFVPRRRTELLAEHAVQLLATMTGLATLAGPTANTGPTVVELCCGSGAVTLAIAAQTASSASSASLASSPKPATLPKLPKPHKPATLPKLPKLPKPRKPELFAVDLQPEAVECARTSLAGLATVLAGDLFSALPRDLIGRVDVVVANAPYIPTAQLAALPREARDYEPVVTLDGGSDGLDLIRRIISTAPAWLRPGGNLLLECSQQQAETVRGIMELRGFTPETIRREASDATIAVGRWARCNAEAPE